MSASKIANEVPTPKKPFSETEHGVDTPGPMDLALELLKSSQSGLEIRRKWLKLLCERLSATHALIDNMSWHPQAGALLFHDMCFWSSDATWIALEPMANAFTMADSQFEPQHLGEWMSWTLAFEHEQPPPMVEMLWKPFQLSSGVTLSVSHDGHYAGGLTLFRDKGCPRQFDETDMSDASSWEAATQQLLIATFSMLGHGGMACGVFLFGADGQLWLENASSDATTQETKAIQPIVDAFIASGDETCVQSIDLHSLHLSWLQGDKGRAVLAISHPLKAAKMSAVNSLSLAERRVAEMASKGAETREIAKALGKSVATVKSHLEHIYLVLGVECRAELARMYSNSWQLQC